MRGVLGLLVGLMGVIGLPDQAAAQEENGLPGIDTARGGKGSITLRLLQEPTGRRTRVLTGATGFQIRLAGRAEGDLAEGTITDGQARGLCAAKRDGDHLVLVLAAAGKDDQPDPACALNLVPDCGDWLAASPGASEAAPSSGEAPGAIGGAAPPAAEPTRPQASPVELSSAAREWDQRLRGQRLTLFSSDSSGGGGYCSRRDRYLGPNGQFCSSAASSVSVCVPGATGEARAATRTPARGRS